MEHQPACLQDRSCILLRSKTWRGEVAIGLVSHLDLLLLGANDIQSGRHKRWVFHIWGTVLTILVRKRLQGAFILQQISLLQTVEVIWDLDQKLLTFVPHPDGFGTQHNLWNSHLHHIKVNKRGWNSVRLGPVKNKPFRKGLWRLLFCSSSSSKSSGVPFLRRVFKEVSKSGEIVYELSVNITKSKERC